MPRYRDTTSTTSAAACSSSLVCVQAYSICCAVQLRDVLGIIAFLVFIQSQLANLIPGVCSVHCVIVMYNATDITTRIRVAIS